MWFYVILSNYINNDRLSYSVFLINGIYLKKKTFVEGIDMTWSLKMWEPIFGVFFRYILPII